MRSYQASFGALIWTKGPICNSNEMYLYENKEGGIFHLMKFKSVDEANKIYSPLLEKRHPNLANVLPIFMVEGENSCFLALEKLGDSLTTFLDSEAGTFNGKRFFQDHRISSFYQKILMDLLLVVRHLMDSKIKCALTLSDTYILDGITPHVTLIKFTSRDYCGANSDWKQLAPLVESINEKTGYKSRESEEMRTFISFLKHPCKTSLLNMATLPLFWTPEQRRLFVCTIWDCLKLKYFPLCTATNGPFGNNPCSWISIVQNDDQLRKIKVYLDTSSQSTKSQEKGNPALMNLYEQETRNCLNFIRKSLSHFQQMKRKITLVFQNENELASYFERKFPNYIMVLYHRARVYEGSVHNYPMKLLPEKKLLSKLYKESAE